MPNWLLKAAAQKILSHLPAGGAVNRLLQSRLTRTLDLGESRLTAQLKRTVRHLEAFVVRRGRLPRRALEVGTGWHPILPLGLHLCGVAEVDSLDRVPLMGEPELGDTLRALAALHRKGGLADALPRLQPARADQLGEITPSGRGSRAGETMRALADRGVRFRIGAIADAGLPAGSVDLLITNSVLEHLKEEELESLLAAQRRLAGEEAVASHFIDLGDHYAVFDRTVDVYNFLQFSRRTWRWVNSRLHYQSRLRIPQYRRLLAATGWTIAAEESQRGTPADLAKVPLAEEFRSIPADDLLVYRSWIAATPTPFLDPVAG